MSRPPVAPDPEGARRHPPSRTVSGGLAVVGFDATAASLNALAYATGWASRIGGRLDVLYVAGDGWQWAMAAGAITHTVGPLPDRVSDLSGIVADLLGYAGPPWSYHIGSGDIAHALEEHARRAGAEAIIVGRSRRRPHALRATTAHQLLGCSDRIVIVVP